MPIVAAVGSAAGLGLATSFRIIKGGIKGTGVAAGRGLALGYGIYEFDVGRGCKIYRLENNFRREDARIIGIDNDTGIINARTIQQPRTWRDIPYVRDSDNTTEIYWTELPEGYEPGSGGQ